MARRRCPAPRCPHLIPQGARYCPEHAREYEAKRGTPAQRGYDQQHRTLRAQWATRIDLGLVQVTCPRCGKDIRPGEPFDLGHPTGRDGDLAPEHASCNRSEGGKRGRATQGLSGRASAAQGKGRVKQAPGGHTGPTPLQTAGEGQKRCGGFRPS